MAAGAKLHEDEADTDEALVAALIRAQFPRWARLPVSRVVSAGTDNAMYRLGHDLVVRLPRIPGAAADVAKEHRWLPHLAPQLPLDVPEPLGGGVAGEGFPHPWSVYRWLDGENLFDEPVADLYETGLRGRSQLRHRRGPVAPGTRTRCRGRLRGGGAAGVRTPRHRPAHRPVAPPGCPA
ncbi:phosphotransferase [Streptomyces sp. NPDC001373]|uniref:phosphotransferase n=1 Tax=Streptomyces sp. NPDC001373 TaxID=3364565 RepID=UPI00368966FF